MSRKSRFTVGSLIGRTPPRSGALAPGGGGGARIPFQRVAVSREAGAARGPSGGCCGSGCPGCPYAR